MDDSFLMIPGREPGFILLIEQACWLAVHMYTLLESEHCQR